MLRCGSFNRPLEIRIKEKAFRRESSVSSTLFVKGDIFLHYNLDLCDKRRTKEQRPQLNTVFFTPLKLTTSQPWDFRSLESFMI